MTGGQAIARFVVYLRSPDRPSHDFRPLLLRHPSRIALPREEKRKSREWRPRAHCCLVPKDAAGNTQTALTKGSSQTHADAQP